MRSAETERLVVDALGLDARHLAKTRPINTRQSSQQTNDPVLKPQEWEPPIPLDQFNPPEFPVHVLPAWLAQYIGAEAHATQTPLDLAALLAICVCSAALARKIEVQAKWGHVEPVNLYGVIVLASGERKSAVFGHTISPMVKFEKEQLECHRSELAREESKYRIAVSALQKAEQRAAIAAPEDSRACEEEATRLAAELAEMRVPAPIRYIADDCSPERLKTLLHEQNGRMAVMSAEGDVFDLMAGKYLSSGQSNFGVFLNGHAGDDIYVDRVKRPSEYVSRPALTLGLAVQPEVLRGLSNRPGFRGRGLLGRFLYSIPKSRVGSRQVDAEAVPEDIVNTYDQHIRGLFQLPFPAESECVPRVGLTPAARQALDDFEIEVEQMLAPGGSLDYLKDWGGKLVGAVVRIAGILHVAERNETTWLNPIEKETIERAITIGEYLRSHAQIAFSQMGADPSVEGAVHVLDWIKGSGVREFSRRDAFQATKGRFKRVAPLTEALMVLEEHYFIRRKQMPQRDGPGRSPSPIYEVNSALLAQYSQNPQKGIDQ